MKTKLITRINNVDIIATNDEQLVAIRPICDALGIDYSRQLKKIKEDEDLCSVMGSTPTTGADGKQYEMSCLPIRYIFGWLFSINPMNVRPEAKEAVRIYRKACYDALYDHFIGSYKRANEQISLENESTHIYLKQKEIARLYYYDGLTKKQEEIRDLFIVGCMTGQRYSDYSRISTDNIKGDNIIILQKKTKNKAVVPMTDYIREIFNKYDGHLPKARCIQYFNKALKLICRKAGLTDWITYEEDQGGEIVMVKKQKCDMISSHTARRTFITNTISDKIPENMIMKLTGHKSSACFVRYNRMTLEDNAKALAGNGYLA